MVNRREFLAVAGVLPLTPLPSVEMVAAKMVRLSTQSNCSNKITNPEDVVKDGLSRLFAVAVKDGWGGNELGRVEGWFIRDGWLWANLTVPSSIATQLREKKVVAAPSFFEDTDPKKEGHYCTRLKSCDEVAIVPFADGLWLEHR